jgi:drug/metabolite transporter (DMT)-like permease
LPTPDRRLRGYTEIAIASVILGTSATLVQVTTMPSSLLVVLRMGLGGLALGVLFLLTGGLAEVRRSRRGRRLFLAGLAVGLELLFYFAAIRLTNVTVGVSLEYMAPVYLTLLAPWLLHTRRRAVDVAAIATAVGGMAFILFPSLTFAWSKDSLLGIVCGLLAGVMFATALLLIKSVGPDVRGSTVALFFCLGSVALIAPLAAWQTLASSYQLTLTDGGIIAINGLVYTALCFSLFTDGVRFVRVEHAGILGYLEPVTAPLWAFLLIGERPPWTTLAGGALIVLAGVLIVALGANAGEQPLIEPLA